MLQETLLQALANGHLWQPGSDLRGWLFTIMRHCFLAGIVKSNRALAAQQICAADCPITVSDPREARLILRDVAAALRRLPIKQRAAVLLAGIEDKSYQEAAAAMGLSVAAVRSQLARGRSRLRVAVDGGETRSPFPAAMPLAPALTSVWVGGPGD